MSHPCRIDFSTWTTKVIGNERNTDNTHTHTHTRARAHTHAHTRSFNGPLSATTQVSWYRTREVKPIWILLKQETVSGSGISWAISKSAPRSRQITTPALHHSVFYRPDALPAAQPTASKHWRQATQTAVTAKLIYSVSVKATRFRTEQVVSAENNELAWYNQTIYPTKASCMHSPSEIG